MRSRTRRLVRHVTLVSAVCRGICSQALTGVLRKWISVGVVW